MLNADVLAEDAAESFARQHLGGRSVGGDAAAIEQNDPRAEGGGKVEVVRGGDAQCAFGAKRAQGAEHLDLVRQIHESAGFIQQQRAMPVVPPAEQTATTEKGAT